MKKLSAVCIFAAFMITPGLAQPQSSNSTVDPGLLPGNPIYGIETAVERAEVNLAGLIGGPDLKAKAIANNAQERLSEANALADRNRSEAASRAIKGYEKAMNRSQKIIGKGNNSELSEKIRNISRNNVEQLVQVREKVPEQARKGIDRAIRNSKRNGRPNLSKKNGFNSKKPEVPTGNKTEGKMPDIENRKPNKSSNKLDNTTQGTDPDRNNSERASKNSLEEDNTNSSINGEEEGSTQEDSNGTPENENLSDGLGNQLPEQ